MYIHILFYSYSCLGIENVGFLLFTCACFNCFSGTSVDTCLYRKNSGGFSSKHYNKHAKFVLNFWEKINIHYD